MCHNRAFIFCRMRFLREILLQYDFYDALSKFDALWRCFYDDLLVKVWFYGFISIFRLVLPFVFGICFYRSLSLCITASNWKRRWELFKQSDIKCYSSCSNRTSCWSVTNQMLLAVRLAKLTALQLLFNLICCYCIWLAAKIEAEM